MLSHHACIFIDGSPHFLYVHLTCDWVYRYVCNLHAEKVCSLKCYKKGLYSQNFLGGFGSQMKKKIMEILNLKCLKSHILNFSQTSFLILCYMQIILK